MFTKKPMATSATACAGPAEDEQHSPTGTYTLQEPTMGGRSR